MESNKLTVVQEGSTKIYIHKNDKDAIPSKEMGVFYNKRMEINRDLTCLGIEAYNCLYSPDQIIFVDCMAASGITALRVLQECSNVSHVYINDINPEAVELIHRNLALNEITASVSSPEITVTQKDANFLLQEILQETYSDEDASDALKTRPNIISIDPFGTPNIYVDSAFKTVATPSGLVCITATDTAVLFGVRKNVCQRKYMAKPLKNEYTKETGTRILLHFISRIANVNNIGIVPLLSLYSHHFIRIFALTYKGKKKIARASKNYGYLIHCKSCGHRFSLPSDIRKLPKVCPLCDTTGSFEFAGPLWIAELHKPAFVAKLQALNEQQNLKKKKRINKLLDCIAEESGMPITYYNIHNLCEEIHASQVPRMESIIAQIRQQGFKASRTHFDFTSLKTTMDIVTLKKTLRKLAGGDR